MPSLEGMLRDKIAKHIHRVEIWWPGESPDWLAQAQRLRGRRYLEDRAIPLEALTADGRFVAVDDASSWQILLMDEGRVTGCLKYADRGAGPAHVVTSAMPPEIRGSAELTAVLRDKPLTHRFVEASGWAVARLGFDGAFLIFVAGALEERIGPALHLVTITARRQAIQLMAKLGAKLVVPVYHDPVWQCDMALMTITLSESPYADLMRFTARQLTKVF